MKSLRWVLLLMALAGRVQACIWDAESLAHEKARSHDLAATILGETNAVEDPQKLQARIKELEANRDETNADWWNNLAGAYLRLNQPEAAVKLLEPVVGSFTNDYGMHANLGTAYHLLGRYAEAEKEIARDLEINPEAHFGLEKYHLALLQYLMRDAKYRARHVYVDEFTGQLFFSEGYFLRDPEQAEYMLKMMAAGYSNGIADAQINYDSLVKSKAGTNELMGALGMIAVLDALPAYRTNWNLAADTNFEAGVIYMAQMNPKEPACFTMLGIAAWKKHDYNLAITALTKAISLGSGQPEILTQNIKKIQNYIRESNNSKRGMGVAVVFGLVGVISIIFLLCWLVRALIKPFERRKII